jgi:hypothetical protein
VSHLSGSPGDQWERRDYLALSLVPDLELPVVGPQRRLHLFHQSLFTYASARQQPHVHYGHPCLVDARERKLSKPLLPASKVRSTGASRLPPPGVAPASFGSASSSAVDRPERRVSPAPSRFRSRAKESGLAEISDMEGHRMWWRPP